ncbi:GAF domain-containing protein [Motilibacter rhizosphaerae]|uniref:Sensor-like histidine kinase SenX3 n=1 Tax=Motilibacter rhizosphaerae TaxID=598652 RepID=A0A4V2F4Z3_9ACTN|nr:ATP-binding protein [Motilibacter rhizosphaerae]RZS91019.1 GAF domain-containing protein [Motilibacter rhizosphaerae]
MTEAGAASPSTSTRDDLELRRLEALHEYELLDQPADDELEAAVRVAASVAGVPTATINLIDENRQCQLTTVGFAGTDSPRSDSMCALKFLEGRTVHVFDASQHPDYRDNPWVTGLLADVRFYASVPLVTPQGHVLGTLCVFDSAVKALSADQLLRLEDCAALVLALFERRRQARRTYELAEELQARRAELERSNRELAEFAAVASHDLGSPLTTVSGYLELLEDLRGGELDEDALSWVQTARRGVSRMQGLIAALLSYASAGSGSGAGRRGQVDCGAVLADVLGDLELAVSEAGAEVVAGELPTAYADATLLRQLLQNLVANALRYRRPEGACRIAVTAERTPAGWTFRVADNGRGIPADDRQRVFGMFATAAGSGRPGGRTPGGFGIGLATCQRIVERHGGTIWAEETPGGGATLAFTLPQR